MTANIPGIKIALCIDDTLQYPADPPFSPHERYPEYPFDHISSQINPVYESIRQLFFRLGFDRENFGKKEWNPFKDIVSENQKIVIKPNWVLHKNLHDQSLSGMITHSSFLRVLIDYIVIALNGTGEIIIGDAPIQSADFTEICNRSQTTSTLSFLQEKTKVKFKLKDFRREITIRRNGAVVEHVYHDNGDFIQSNLGRDSFLTDISHQYNSFRVTNYDKAKMLRYHNENDHIYVIHKNILEADAVFCLPKLKSHRKAGLTCCLKNSVGINCQKDCLPHHRKRSLEEGGDAYRKASLLKRIKEDLYEKFDKTHSLKFQQLYMLGIRIINRLIKTLSIANDFEGSWYGNDTVWRTILDINRILFFADSQGKIHNKPQRKLFYLVDGIIAGEGEGPLEPCNRHFGLVAAGENPLAVDLAISKIIGFDYKKIPSLSHAVTDSFLWEPATDTGELPICFNNNAVIPLEEMDLNLAMEPSAGWKDHIELDS